MTLYHQLKFPSTFIEYRSVSEWKGVVVISNFDSLEIYRPRQLPSLPRPKYAPGDRGCGHFEVDSIYRWAEVAVVAIATRSGLDGLGIESRWGRVFPHPSRLALGPTNPSVI